MSIAQLPSEILVPIGQLGFGDITAILGKQTQPAFVWSDFMGGTSPDYVRHGSSLRLNKIAGVAHAPESFVPHHQLISGVVTVDGGVYIAARPDMPSVTWSRVATGSSPSSGSSALNYQAFPDRHHQFEWTSFALKTSASTSDTAPTLTQHFQATQWGAPASGGNTDMDEQGFTLQFSKFNFGGATQSNPAQIEVWWNVHGPGSAASEGGTFGLILSQKSAPLLYYNQGGGTGVSPNSLIRTAFTNNPLATKGSASIGGNDSAPFVKVSTIGGRMQIDATGLGEPIVVNLDNLLRGDADSVTGTTTALFNKLLRFPSSGKIWYWKHGGNPSSQPGWKGGLAIKTISTSTNSQASLGTQSSVTFTSTTGAAAGDTLAVLEPRIGAVDLVFRRITHASWALHPARFEPQWTYTSIEQQVAFTKSSATPWYYTTHCAGDFRYLVGGSSWSHHLYPGSLITCSDTPGIAGTEIHQFTLAASCPSIASYDGSLYARYTVPVQRVDSHIAGIHSYTSPTPANTTLVTLNEDSPQSRLIKRIRSSQNFDIGSLQVTNHLEVTVDNYNGRYIDLIGKLGIGGIGNIGVMFRWGFFHQEAANYKGTGWFGVNGPGFSRYVGYADTFSYSGRNCIISCPDDFDRVRNYPLMVPPLIDGWNHYRAVYTLLQMAGVPDSRIGFMSRVPPTPSDLAAADPDFATGGYFLPVGIGANPWTPIYSDIKIGALLSMIQQVSGCVIYCDSLGVYQYEPFLRSTPVGVPKRVFRTYDVLDDNLSPVQYYAETVTFSTADVRNKVVLVGIDAYGPANMDYIVVKIEDGASIQSDVGSQPINYVGFPSPFVMIDSRFASRAFATDAASRIFKQLRLPSIPVVFSCTAGQPDLYVMDWVVLEHFRSGLTGFPASPTSLPLFVTNVEEVVEFDPHLGPVTHTVVQARYIDPSLVGTDSSGVLAHA